MPNFSLRLGTIWMHFFFFSELGDRKHRGFCSALSPRLEHARAHIYLTLGEPVALERPSVESGGAQKVAWSQSSQLSIRN